MRFLVFLAVALAVPVAAFAQEVNPAPALTGWLDLLLTLAGAVVTPLFIWLFAIIRKNLNERTALIVQEIFINALKGAAGATINDVDINKVIRQGGLAVTDIAVQKGVEVLKNSIPDTLKKLNKTDAELAQRIVNQVSNTLIPALVPQQAATVIVTDKK